MKYLLTVFVLIMSVNVFADEPAEPDKGGPDKGEPGKGVAPDTEADIAASKGFVLIENAIEAEKLRMSLSEELHGFVEGKMCDECDEIRVVITPETRAYENNREVPLIKAKSRIGRFATVLFDIKTNNVTAIKW